MRLHRTDHLLFIDGIRVFNLKPEAVDDFLLGAPDTSVSLGIVRKGIDMTFEVSREIMRATPQTDASGPALPRRVSCRIASCLER